MTIALDPQFVVEIRRSPRTGVTGRSFGHPEALPLAPEVYLRRRLVVGLVVLGVAVAACLGLRAVASRGDGPAPVSTVTPAAASGLASGGAAANDLGIIDAGAAYVVYDGRYVVQPGDTLWSIASSLTEGSVRGYVDDLIELNGSASIDVGQALVLPTN
jgi:hypothetical protein